MEQAAPATIPHRRASRGHGSNNTAPTRSPEHQQGCNDDKTQRRQDHSDDSQCCGVVIRARRVLYRQ